MVEVDFHSGVADRADYACRLIRKAWRSGRPVVVFGPAPTLARLDQLLWTFDPGDFVPHARLSAGQAMPQRLAPTPIWLVQRLDDAPSREVLVHLGHDALPTNIGFARVVEIVGLEDDEVQAGRERWRAYKALGWTLRSHVREPAAR